MKFRRVPKGVPAGGQFAADTRDEVTLLGALTARRRSDATGVGSEIAAESARAVLDQRALRGEARQARARKVLDAIFRPGWPKASSANISTRLHEMLVKRSDRVRLADSLWLGQRVDIVHSEPIHGPEFLSRLARTEDRAYKGVDDGGQRTRPCVMVTRIECPDGSVRHLVNIPGTGSLLGPDGINADLATLGAAENGRRSCLAAKVVEAMERSDIAEHEEVLISGHSLGGMAAAEVAACAEVRARFRVVGIVTYGSPIATYQVPESVSVLAFEHHEDPVPRLDRTPNPVRPGWVTFARSAPDFATFHRAHGRNSYRRTIADFESADSTDLHTWRSAHAGFLEGRTRAHGFPLVSHHAERYERRDQAPGKTSRVTDAAAVTGDDLVRGRVRVAGVDASELRPQPTRS